MSKPKIEIRIVHFDAKAFNEHRKFITRIIYIPEYPDPIWLPSFGVDEWECTPEAIIKQALRFSRYSVKWYELHINFGKKLMLHAVRGTPEQNTVRLVTAELER
jgi:hypothetical protein